MEAWKKIRRKGKRTPMVHAWYACMYGNERECVSPMVLTKHTGCVNYSYNCVAGGTGEISFDVVAGPGK